MENRVTQDTCRKSKIVVSIDIENSMYNKYNKISDNTSSER